jgi:hypothetical protein
MLTDCKIGLMFKQYKFPINIFLILEKVVPVVYTSECITPNHYALLLPKEWYTLFNKIIRNEVTLCSSTLIEQSCIDTKYFDRLDEEFHIKLKNGRLMFYSIYYFYYTKVRLTLMVNLNLLEVINSVESFYKNAG